MGKDEKKLTLLEITAGLALLGGATMAHNAVKEGEKEGIDSGDSMRALLVGLHNIDPTIGGPSDWAKMSPHLLKAKASVLAKCFEDTYQELAGPSTSAGMEHDLVVATLARLLAQGVVR